MHALFKGRGNVNKLGIGTEMMHECVVRMKAGCKKTESTKSCCRIDAKKTRTVSSFVSRVGSKWGMRIKLCDGNATNAK